MAAVVWGTGATGWKKALEICPYCVHFLCEALYILVYCLRFFQQKSCNGFYHFRFYRQENRLEQIDILPNTLRQVWQTHSVNQKVPPLFTPWLLLAAWQLPGCLSQTHHLRGLLSFFVSYSWSSRTQGSAWYIVGVQEIFVIEGRVLSLSFFLLWVRISMSAHKKVLNCIFHINGNRDFDMQLYNPPIPNIFINNT